MTRHSHITHLSAQAPKGCALVAAHPSGSSCMTNIAKSFCPLIYLTALASSPSKELQITVAKAATAVMAFQLGTRPLALRQQHVLGNRKANLTRLSAVPKETDISTKDWRAQKMADTVRIFFDKVWSRGEVQLLDQLLTDDFVWKVRDTVNPLVQFATQQTDSCVRSSSTGSTVMPPCAPPLLHTHTRQQRTVPAAHSPSLLQAVAQQLLYRNMIRQLLV